MKPYHKPQITHKGQPIPKPVPGLLTLFDRLAAIGRAAKRGKEKDEARRAERERSLRNGQQEPIC